MGSKIWKKYEYISNFEGHEREDVVKKTKEICEYFIDFSEWMKFFYLIIIYTIRVRIDGILSVLSTYICQQIKILK